MPSTRSSDNTDDWRSSPPYALADGREASEYKKHTAACFCGSVRWGFSESKPLQAKYCQYVLPAAHAAPPDLSHDSSADPFSAACSTAARPASSSTAHPSSGPLSSARTTSSSSPTRSTTLASTTRARSRARASCRARSAASSATHRSWTRATTWCVLIHRLRPIFPFTWALPKSLLRSTGTCKSLMAARATKLVPAGAARTSQPSKGEQRQGRWLDYACSPVSTLSPVVLAQAGARRPHTSCFAAMHDSDACIFLDPPAGPAQSVSLTRPNSRSASSSLRTSTASGPTRPFGLTSLSTRTSSTRAGSRTSTTASRNLPA